MASPQPPPDGADDLPRDAASSDGSLVGHRLVDLDPATRSRQLRRSLLVSAGYVVGQIAAYFVIPFGGGSVGGVVARSAVGAVLVAAVVVIVVWQLRAVATAEIPALRAIEGFALSIPLVLVAFAAIFLSLSIASPASFSEPLDHVGALYFAMTSMTTVGFGDIAATSDTARVVVMVQMVANVAVLGVATRVAIHAVQRGSGADAS